MICYMSCGSRSFLEDAKRLTKGAKSFRLSWLRCYDMFPFTEHREILGIFVRESTESVEESWKKSSTSSKMVWKPWEDISFLQGQVPRMRGRWQCQFLVGIEADGFGVVGRLLGRRGANMKRIAAETQAKMRLRGRGSGFKELDLGAESTDPLMLCLSAPDADSYRSAALKVHELLETIYLAYEFTGKDPPAVRVHEGPRE